ncbi:MAG TPA: c-type cytochrome [Anaerolineales bacterium]|nr:c-type cytochrome [Anaerolineales bacterium]
MNEEQKKQYKEKYAQAKQVGVKFWPDIIYKDLVISVALFIILVILATWIGVAQEAKADPSDSAYIPRPEWYFLFLFQLLKYFPGSLEWLGTTVIPIIAVLALFLLPFFDRNSKRHWKSRPWAIGIMSVMVVGIIALTILAVVSTPPQEVTGTIAGTIPEQILAGQDLYSVNCVECHGADGEGGEIKGVEGLEGYIMKAINTKDEMYTRDDPTLNEIVSYGQPDLGMTPFGRAFGGALGPSDIEAIVTFMRYTWDDRVELPKEVTAANAIPTVAPGQVPSYEVQIAAIQKRYCVSCHRAGKKNNNYLMGNYDDTIKTGDHAPDLIAGDLLCNTMQMLNRVEGLEAGNPMPPTKALPPELVEIYKQWILAGMPNTAADAAAITAPTATPAGTQAPGSTTPVITPTP